MRLRAVILLRRALPFLAACLALFLVGCSLLPSNPAGVGVPPGALPAELAGHRDAWNARGIDDYTWVVQLSCECASNGEATIKVVDGRVVEQLVPPGFGPENGDLPVSTVDGLFEEAARTIAAGGDVRATWDGPGIPTSITFDPIPNAIDDELSVTVVSLTPSD